MVVERLEAQIDNSNKDVTFAKTRSHGSRTIEPVDTLDAHEASD